MDERNWKEDEIEEAKIIAFYVLINKEYIFRNAISYEFLNENVILINKLAVNDCKMSDGEEIASAVDIFKSSENMLLFAAKRRLSTRPGPAGTACPTQISLIHSSRKFSSTETERWCECFLMKMWRNDVSNIFSGRHYYQFIWIYLSHVSFLFRPISSKQLIVRRRWRKVMMTEINSIYFYFSFISCPTHTHEIVICVILSKIWLKIFAIIFLWEGIKLENILMNESFYFKIQNQTILA